MPGRTFEGYGEDPWLSSRLAVRWIQGAQSQGVIGNVKHFAPNSQEGAPPGAPPLASAVGGRFIVDARVDPRALREIYLPPFEAAVKEADVGTIMCAYNRLNGSPACENRELLQRILRDDWGFDGFVVADYGFATKSTADSANNGLELDMPQGFFYSRANLAAAVATGQVSSATIDLRVGNILRTLFRFGAFDRAAYPVERRPDRQGGPRRCRARGLGAGDRAAAQPRDAAARTPAKLNSIAVIGADADAYKGGGGSSAVQAVLRAAQLAPRSRAGPVPACRCATTRATTASARPRWRAGADVALVFASDTATEGVDKSTLATDDDALVDAVAAANPRTTVVLETAGPVLTPWRERVNAIVEAWYPGQAGGKAIARVLFGDTDPGRPAAGHVPAPRGRRARPRATARPTPA